MKALIKKRYPFADDKLLQQIGQRGVPNSRGEPDDFIVVGPKGGKSGPKIVVREGYDYGLSDTFVNQYEELLGSKAEDLIKAQKQQEHELKCSLEAERQQLKETQKVDAELDS